MTDEQLHAHARAVAATLVDPDRKQLRFNEIVRTAREYYNDPTEGVDELVRACCRSRPQDYVKGSPMWKSLSEDYQWMRHA